MEWKLLKLDLSAVRNLYAPGKYPGCFATNYAHRSQRETARSTDTAWGRFGAWRTPGGRPRRDARNGLFILIVIAAIFSPWVAPHDPLDQDLAASKQPPSWMLGKVGTSFRDRCSGSRPVQSHRLRNARLADGRGFRRADRGQSRLVIGMIVSLVNILLALPYLLFVVFIASVLGRSLANVVLIFGITNVPLFVRVTRGEVLRIRKTAYVEAAVSLGGARRGFCSIMFAQSRRSADHRCHLSNVGDDFLRSGLGFLGLSVRPACRVGEICLPKVANT